MKNLEITTSEKFVSVYKINSDGYSHTKLATTILDTSDYICRNVDPEQMENFIKCLGRKASVLYLKSDRSVSCHDIFSALLKKFRAGMEYVEEGYNTVGA